MQGNCGHDGGDSDDVLDTERRRDSNAILLQLQLFAADFKELKAMVERLSKGFPGGDPDGHRAAHEEWIRQVKARTEFWEKMRFELVKWGLLGFAAFVALAAWREFLKGPKP